jgi:RHS repeat-associated protein
MGYRKRQTMTDPSGTTTYTYDPQTDRLASKQTSFGTISYTYDAAGDVTQIASSNASGSVVAYQYDKLNRLSTVVVAGQSPTVYGYDEVGNLAGYTYPNGVATTLQYDGLNRLTNLASKGQQGTVASYAYTLGAAGNRTGVTELSGRTVSYGYDTLYRLSSETIANSAMSGTVGYTYDAVGNRKQVNSTLAAIPASGLLNYDANDRTLTDTYDNNGNTVAQGGVADSYDFENHLIQHGYITLVYDGDGNRVAKTIGGVTTSYLVDTLNPTGYAQVLDELQGKMVARSYTWGLELVSEAQVDTAIQPPLNPWVTSWYGFDGHGSVRYLTGSSGAVTDTYDYDAFGNLISSTGSTANNYLFAGEQFDPNLGLYYNRARYLDVRAGRFWGMDTEEGNPNDPLSLHKYLYTEANPVDGLDPSGNDDIAAIGMSMGSTLDSIPTVNFPKVLELTRFDLGTAAGLISAQTMATEAESAARRNTDPKAFRKVFGSSDTSLVSSNYMLIISMLYGPVHFTQGDYSDCNNGYACAPLGTAGGKLSSLDITVTPRFFPLWQVPNSDPLGSPNQLPSKGGAIVHETAHSAFGAKDLGYYGNALKLKGGDALQNADSYRLFAEHVHVAH